MGVLILKNYSSSFVTTFTETEDGIRIDQKRPNENLVEILISFNEDFDEIIEFMIAISNRLGGCSMFPNTNFQITSTSTVKKEVDIPE